MSDHAKKIAQLIADAARAAADGRNEEVTDCRDEIESLLRSALPAGPSPSPAQALPSTRLRLLGLAEGWREDARAHGPRGDSAYSPYAAAALAQCSWDLERALGVEPHPDITPPAQEEPPALRDCQRDDRCIADDGHQGECELPAPAPEAPPEATTEGKELPMETAPRDGSVEELKHGLTVFASMADSGEAMPALHRDEEDGDDPGEPPPAPEAPPEPQGLEGGDVLDHRHFYVGAPPQAVAAELVWLVKRDSEARHVGRFVSRDDAQEVQQALDLAATLRSMFGLPPSEHLYDRPELLRRVRELAARQQEGEHPEPRGWLYEPQRPAGYHYTQDPAVARTWEKSGCVPVQPLYLHPAPRQEAGEDGLREAAEDVWSDVADPLAPFHNIGGFKIRALRAALDAAPPGAAPPGEGVPYYHNAKQPCGAELGESTCTLGTRHDGEHFDHHSAIRWRSPSVAELETARELREAEPVELYLRFLDGRWSSDTPDYARSLVAGNLRAFFAWLRGDAPTGFPKPPASSIRGPAPSSAAPPALPVEPLSEEVRDALDDALSGWRYIRSMHGDLSGVAWDRVERKLVALMFPGFDVPPLDDPKGARRG